jgi:hypothetical protein
MSSEEYSQISEDDQINIERQKEYVKQLNAKIESMMRRKEQNFVSQHLQMP